MNTFSRLGFFSITHRIGDLEKFSWSYAYADGITHRIGDLEIKRLLLLVV